MKELIKRIHLRHPLWASPKPGPSLRSERGQAVIEYILILVVTVGIALGILYQLNTAFKKYVQNYFGNYIACLLETGEMPTLGGTEGASAGICDSEFEPFSLSGGRPLIEGSGDGGGSRGRRYSRSGNSSSRPNKLTKNRSTLNGDGRSGESTVVASTSSSSKKPSVKGGGNITSGNFKFRTARNRPEEVIRINSRFITATDKGKDSDSGILKEIQGKKEGGRNNRKIAVNMDAFKPKETPPDLNVAVSAGDYLRYILIFAILIGIFVFFGGQINQLRKSWEK